MIFHLFCMVLFVVQLWMQRSVGKIRQICCFSIVQNMTEHSWRVSAGRYFKKMPLKKLICIWASFNERQSYVDSVFCNCFPWRKKSFSKGQESIYWDTLADSALNDWILYKNARYWTCDEMHKINFFKKCISMTHYLSVISSNPAVSAVVFFVCLWSVFFCLFVYCGLGFFSYYYFGSVQNVRDLMLCLPLK